MYKFTIASVHDFFIVFIIKHHIPSRRAASQKVLYTTAVHWKSASAMITSCAWSGSLGCFGAMDSFHVRFIISSSGVIYGPDTGPSSELFISAEDKKKIMALLLRQRWPVYTADEAQGQTASHTHSLFRGIKPCAAHHWTGLIGDWYVVGSAGAQTPCVYSYCWLSSWLTSWNKTKNHSIFATFTVCIRVHFSTLL